ncbi:hypothetical protein F5984_17825 [Rudanella paleaurantiibacter]|uniref:Cytochrome C Planctomycete-type domain-containing protein n=1 Tax=Rudanella paleaurantiibacter TaxID=2614655 RepID=A0A7J5TW88_9BACT|nr:c-type cytochrome domain-containing protein [Rudanella paleaurantiibacter]KAB7728693.1 hypothetical protein F5984_17825 [Rudanella paleaurantiibacter]
MFDFIAHLHPLLVHLPIGILLFAGALMVFGRWRSVDVEAAESLAWGLGAGSALLACGAGWLLAQSGEYDADLVQRHQWTGLATAGFGALTYFIKRYRPALATATVLFLTVAGHYGGNLTHGEDYLFPGAKTVADTSTDLEPTVSAQVGELAIRTNDSGATATQPTVRRTFFYRDRVVPVLETKCYSCHSSRKKKGGLRLDTEAFIRQGGKNGSILTPGNPQKSKLFTYLLLPEGDEMHMPPKGKLQLSRNEIALIHHWIKTGASFKEQIEVIAPAATSSGLVAASTDGLPTNPVYELPVLPANTTPPAGGPVVNAPASAEARLLANPIAAPAPAVLEKLRAEQVTINRLTDAGPYLSANFVNVKSFEPRLLDALAGVGQQVMRLRLSDQPVRDADLQTLRQFPNLTRLNLENTPITDAALGHVSALPNLEQLNLYGTAVTDAGLAQLAQLPNLKVLYLWQTKTTPAGVERLRKARPDLIIETGTLQLAKPDTNKAL